MISFLRQQQGQTLIEVIVALTAAVIVISAIVAATINGLTNSEFTRNQNMATAYSQAGMEIIRDMRNNDISSLSPTNLPDGKYCLAQSCTELTSQQSSCWTAVTPCSQNVGTFVRQVTISQGSDAIDCNVSPTPTGQAGVLPNNVEATVTTSWSDTKCTNTANPFCHSVSLSSCFSDFTVVPTP